MKNTITILLLIISVSFNIYFVNDPHSSTSLHEWNVTIKEVKNELGLKGVMIPFYGDVFLEAFDQKVLFG